MHTQSKRCFKCLNVLPIELFYRHAAMSDGHLNKCKECTKKDANKHRQNNLERIRSYDKLRGGMAHRVSARKEYAKTPKGKAAHARALKKQKTLHPNKAKARNAVSNAIRDGRIAPWPVCAVPECQCKPEAHHPDYDRPLDVVWLCQSHHKQAHALTRSN